MKPFFNLTVVLICSAVAAVGSASRAAPAESPVSDVSAVSKPVPGAAEVQAGLTEGFKIGAKYMPLAQAKFEAARKLNSNDPRVDFAEGLAWAKQVKWQQAQEQFERAKNRPGTPYWPAWQAWVWTAFRNKQFDVGFQRLLELSKQLAATARPSSEPDAAELAVTKWIGRLMSASARLDTTSKGAEAWSRTMTQLKRELGPALSKGVESGRVDFFNEQQGNQVQTQVKSEEKTKLKKQVVEAEQAKIDGGLAKAEKEKTDAKKSAADWKTWLDTETPKFDKELERLEKDYRIGQQQGEALLESIRFIGRELTVLSANEPRLGTPNRVAWENQYLNRQNQLTQNQNEYNATSLKLAELGRQGALLVAQRQLMFRQYEQATGILLGKAAGLDKWSARMNDKKEKLQTKAAKPVTGKDPTTISGYLPLDLEDERDRLLRDLGVAAVR